MAQRDGARVVLYTTFSYHTKLAILASKTFSSEIFQAEKQAAFSGIRSGNLLCLRLSCTYWATEDCVGYGISKPLKCGILLFCIFTARKRSCGKVMFLQASIVHSGKVGISYASWERSYGRVPPFPSTQHQTWATTPSTPLDIRPGHLTPQLPLTSGGHHWWLVQRVDLRTYPSTGTDI